MGAFGDSMSGSNSGDLFGFATGGMFSGTMEAKKARQNAERAAAAARADAQAKEAAIHGNIAKIRENYGIGDSTAALGNKQRLGDLFGETVGAWRGEQNSHLGDIFTGSLRANRFQQADTGNLGGGMDADRQREILGGYAKGRVQIADQAGGLEESLQNSLDEQRQGLEGKIASGSMLDLGGINSLRQQKSALGEAMSNIPLQTMGNLFAQGGQMYQQDQQAQGMGYGGTRNLYGGRSASRAPTATGTVT